MSIVRMTFSMRILSNDSGRNDILSDFLLNHKIFLVKFLDRVVYKKMNGGMVIDLNSPKY